MYVSIVLSFGIMSAMEARGERSVSAGGDIGVAVTGDHNVVTLGPVVRSAYWEQVHRIAPEELVDREPELAEITEFCTADCEPWYAWWRAGTWAGKTALMSWFALHPPPGVRVVPFFVTARLGAQNDVGAYVDVVLEQLAELVGEGLPANLWESTREAHLQRLYREAARVCAERGERLVLLVDGLDEDRGVTTGAGARSIAGLLPLRPIPGMRVLVSGRLNPPLPVDVPDDHPLRAPRIVRLLAQSQHAQVIRAEAERELKHLIEAGGLEYDLLALVVAAGGGLSAEDLAELTGAVPYRVRDVLRTRAGRTFALRGGVYLLCHEELQTQAAEMLGLDELDARRRKLHTWADDWQTRGWPDGTPEYLLRGYFRMLHATGARERMLTCALDEARHDRMLALTGGDVAAVNEVRVVEEGDLQPLDMLRLAIHRDWLGDRHAGLPDGLARAWVALGSASRALALARSIPEAHRRGMELAGVAEELMDRGESGRRVLEVLGEAEACLDQCDDERLADGVRVRVAHLLVMAGQYDHAAEVARTAAPLDEARGPYADAVRAWVALGRDDRVAALVSRAPDEDWAAECATAVVSELMVAGHLNEAEDAALTAVPPARVPLMVRVACAWARGGRPERADSLMYEVKRLTSTPDGHLAIVQALIRAGEVGLAQLRAESVRDWRTRAEARAAVARRLAEDGDYDRAEPWLCYLEGSDRLAALRDLAIAAAREGEYDRAEALARGIPLGQGYAASALAAVAVSLAEGGHVDRAETFARRIVELEGRSAALRGIACFLVAAGEPERATRLLDTLGETGHRTSALIDAAVAASGTGRRRWAEEVLLGIESRSRVPSTTTVTYKVSRTVKALSEAGHRDSAWELLEGIEELVPSQGPSQSAAEDTAGASAMIALAAAKQWERARALIPRFGQERQDDLKAVLSMWQAAAGILDAELPFNISEFPEREAVLYGLAVGREFHRAEDLVSQLREPESDWYLLSWLMYKAGLYERAKDIADRADPGAHPDDSLRVRFLNRAEKWEDIADLESNLARLYEHGSRPRRTQRGINARFILALGRNVTTLPDFKEFSIPQERAQAQEEFTTALIEVGDLTRADTLARSITAPVYAARACTQVALATSDPEQARSLMALALRNGGWVSALPALLKHMPDSLPLVVEAANAMKTACRRDTDPPTEARTSAPSER